MQILGIILAVLILLLFVIYPLILLIKCIFDKKVNAGITIFLVIISLFAFPLPSYYYGAYVRKEGWSKFLYWLCILVIGGIIGLVLLLGGIAGAVVIIEEYIGIDIPFLGSDTTTTDPSASASGLKQEPENDFSNHKPEDNTYRVDEVNVFEAE